MIVTRNFVFCHETDKAYLIKLESSKKTFWIPKQHLTVIDQKVNDMTGRVVYKGEIPQWIFDKIK
jgi:hypothetical protein